MECSQIFYRWIVGFVKEADLPKKRKRGSPGGLPR
jgi:hypothetical protein